MSEFRGRRVLITGAGHGVGRAIAREFARRGAEIVVTDREIERVEETVLMLRGMGCAAWGYPMDVTQIEDVKSVRDRLRAENRSIDILVNNAGIVHGGRFLDVPIEKHTDVYRVNVMGTVIVTQVFLPDLLKAQSAHLVNIASASALIPLPYAATYASSKWAVLGLTESLREELRIDGQHHVGVTAVCPSYIDTGMFNGVRTPLFTRKLTPERLAGMVCAAVGKKRARILTPWLVKLTPLGRATLPHSWFQKLCDWFGVTSGMATWHGHAKPVPHRPVSELRSKERFQPADVTSVG